MTIRALIFDMGGVLLRTEDHQPRLKLSGDLGIDYDGLMKLTFGGESARRATIGEITEEEHWEIVRQQIKKSPAEMAAWCEQFWTADKHDTELIQFIGNLRSRLRTGLLSNAWSGARSAITRRFPGTLDVFDVTIFSAEVGMAKPDAAIYHHILKLMSVEPHEAIFVDDFIENIQAARQLGMVGVHFHDSLQARQDVIAALNH